MSEDTNLINLQLQLQNFTSENTPESLGKAVDALDTSIRRGIPEDKMPAILKLRGDLIDHWQKRAKVEQLKTELSQAPGRLDNESIVDLEQVPGINGGPPSFTLPASETRQEIGRITSSAPLAGTGKHFAKAIVREPTSPMDLAPKRLSPDQIFRINEAGMTNLIPSLQPPMGPALTAEQVQNLGEAGIPVGARTHAAEITPEEFQKMGANEKTLMLASKPAPAGTYLDKEGNKVFPTSALEVMKGNFRKLDQRQEIVLNSAENWAIHNDMMLQYLDILSREGLRPLTSLKATLQRFNNNPKAQAAFSQLEALTPFAASAVVAAGSSMRGGAMAAKLLQPSTVIAGDTLESALEKLANNYQLSIQRAKFAGANIEPFQTRLDMVNKMKRGEGYIIMNGFDPVFVRNK